MLLAARAIEAFVIILTVGSGIFVSWILIGLLRIGRAKEGKLYRGGIGQWSWAFHRITGILVFTFLVGHIVDTYAVGFGPELYDETIELYKQWWFKPVEVALVAAVLYHALNGVRVILFDFWPNLVLRQKAFAYVQLVLFVAGFAPTAFFMLRSAYEHSPFA